MPNSNAQEPPGDNKTPGAARLRLTPGDQLLSISVVNFILCVASWAVLGLGYQTDQPSLPTWMFVASAILLIGPAALATSDSWLAKAQKVLTGGVDTPDNRSWDLNENILRGAVFAFTIVNLVVLWKLTDQTAGVAGPFVPFLTAPAVFSPFVARNPLPIGVLSLTVVGGLWILDHSGYSHGQIVTPADWTYKLVATMMIVIAGTLTMVRLSVEKRGGALLGTASSEDKDPDDKSLTAVPRLVPRDARVLADEQ